MAFGLGALSYPIGTMARMGPGFYPLVVAILLIVVGALILVRPVTESEEPAEPPAWRAVVVIVAAILLFGLTVRGLGLIPSIFLAATLASLASERTTILRALALGAGLTVVSLLIFVVALRLNLPLLGPLVPRF